MEATDPYPAPDTVVENEDERNRMLERMAKLDGRERSILMLRYGLAEDEPMTLSEIGHRMGITREWVRKIEMRAIQKLNGAQIEDFDEETAKMHIRQLRVRVRRRRPPPAVPVRPAVPSKPKPDLGTLGRPVRRAPRPPAPPPMSSGLYWLYDDSP